MASPDPAAEAPAGHAAKRDAQSANRACPHYTSSPASMAWLVDAWLRKIWHPAPRDVRMSSGCTARVGDMRVSLVDAAALVRVL